MAVDIDSKGFLFFQKFMKEQGGEVGGAGIESSEGAAGGKVLNLIIVLS